MSDVQTRHLGLSGFRDVPAITRGGLIGLCEKERHASHRMGGRALAWNRSTNHAGKAGCSEHDNFHLVFKVSI